MKIGTKAVLFGIALLAVLISLMGQPGAFAQGEMYWTEATGGQRIQKVSVPGRNTVGVYGSEGRPKVMNDRRGLVGVPRETQRYALFLLGGKSVDESLGVLCC